MRGGQHWRGPGLCAVLLVCLVLAGCAGRSPAPIEDRGATPAPTGRSYRVQPGDTLYSIAWRYGLDYARLAAANDVPPPFTIYVGQQLALREAEVVAVAPSSPPRPSPQRSAQEQPSTAPATASTPKPVAATPKPALESVSAAPPRPPLRPTTSPPEAAVGSWRWPAEGPVVRGFSSTLHKGIDIGGEVGDPVTAVAAGQVVYAGTGIPGYGELLIVRHNARYLSAYGHNDRLLVREGDSVRAGEKIATRGSSGTNSVKLHFEIRENGKPVDPMGLLPRR